MKEDTLVARFNELIEAKPTYHLPTKAPDYEVEDGGVPKEMEAGPIKDDWVVWKWVPSRVTADDIRRVEKEAGVLSVAVRAYLRCHSHLHSETRYGGEFLMLIALPSDAPLAELEHLLAESRPLTQAGYVPFAIWGQGYGTLCLDTRAGSGDGDFPVVALDADQVTGLDEPLTRESLATVARPFAPSSEEVLLEALAWRGPRSP